jgi:L-ascorbate metabolism protein UlaG (beta-lactamase superfamily)
MASTEEPPHFDGKRYYNPGGARSGGFLDLLRWQWTSRPEPSPGFVPDVIPCRPPRRVEHAGLRVTMVNHSTVLLQVRGCNILTDPIWSDRASPVPWAGPRRRRAPGVQWEDLPPIHVVLLSHNHYDHMDSPTLRRLARRGESTCVAAKGLEKLVRTSGFGQVSELDWGESVTVGEVRIHGVAAQHFSARGLFDRNRTLWCGYMVESSAGLVYFAGDTGFGPHFARIRERFGPPRLALLPIGAYEPRWFMRPVHMSPEEAVQAHHVLGAETSVAIHHGTFQLTDEGLDTPRKRLTECAGAARFQVLANGKFTEIA